MIKVNQAKFKQWRDEHVEKEVNRMFAQLDSNPGINDQDVIVLFMRMVMNDVLIFVRELEREQVKEQTENEPTNEYIRDPKGAC